MTRQSTLNSASFSASALVDLNKAIEARSKAIRYKTKSMSVHRELSGTENEEEERLILEVNTIEPRPTNIRLQVWPDRSMWFGAYKAAESGWSFKLAFDGYPGEMTDHTVVSNFEKSLEYLFEPDSTGEAGERVLVIWSTPSLRCKTRPINWLH